MADLIALGGVATTAGSWGTVDTASLLDSEANTVAISTSNIDTATFVLPAVPVDAVALHISARAASPSGTLSVILRNSTTGTDVKTTTINVADVHVTPDGYIVVKFASSHTPNGTDSYLLRAVCSASGSQITLYRNGTSNNFSRRIRTTTTQAPASGNHLLICNELTGAGTNNAITITWDNTATTSFGPTVSGGPPYGVVVSGGGTLTLQNSASTNYYLKMKGIFLVSAGGTVNFGASGSQLVSTSTFILEFDSASNVDSGLRIMSGGTYHQWGPTKTICALLTADVAGSGTALTVTDTTGWESADLVEIASTTHNGYSDNESKVLNVVGSSTTASITVGLSTARTNVAVYPPEIINRTCRSKLRGVSTSLSGYVIVLGTGVLDLRYVEIAQLGSGSNDKRGIDYQQTGAGSATVQACAFHDFNSGNSFQVHSWRVNSAGVNTTIKDCGAFNVCPGDGSWVTIPGTPPSTITLDGNYTVRGGGNYYLFQSVSITAFKNNRMSNQQTNTSAALHFSFTNGTIYQGWGEALSANWAGNVMHNNNSYGLRLRDASGLNFGNAYPVVINFYFKSWLLYLNNIVTSNAAVGLQNGTYINMTFDTCKFFGNAIGILVIDNYSTLQNLRMISCESAGAVTTNTAVQTTTLHHGGGLMTGFLENCNFGRTGTGFTTETNNIAFSANGTTKIVASNCKFGATNITTGMSTVGDQFSYLRSNRHGQVAGDHREYTKNGNRLVDTVIFHSGSPSERLIPSNASVKYESSPWESTVASGVTRTFFAYARKSASGDAGGANYNGSQPRLMLRRQFEGGITADTVLATMTAAVGNWELLTGAASSSSDDCVMEAFIDLDGTAGWVNVDDRGKS